MSAKFEIIQMHPINTNSVLVSAGDNCVIFDAWGITEDWEKLLKNRGLKLVAIFTTHGHYDHISAAPALSEKLNIPWYLHNDDLEMVPFANLFLPQYGMPKIAENFKRPVEMPDGKINIFDDVFMNIIKCPGHSRGGVSFYLEKLKILIAGDTIFRDGIGRYDFPGGDSEKLFESILRLRGLNLPDDTTVISGHGDVCTIGWMKQNHKYFKN